MGDMKGQVAIVTGGTRGIGLAISERLLNRGVTVAAGYATNHDHAREFADKYADRGVSIHQGNVGHNQDVLRVFGEVLDRHGHVDILVNNAGITRDMTFRKMTKVDWDAVLRTNLDSVFNVTKQVIDDMVERNWGRIINISSVNGEKGQFGQTNYSAAKAGMHGFTMALAQEVANKGVTVNTVSPGYIATDMVKAIRLVTVESGFDPREFGLVAFGGAGALHAVDLARALSFDERQQLDRHAPESIQVPSGRTHPLEYEEDGTVSASVKLQELFGLAETPRVGRQREAVVLALLAPNGRPVQVTRDLRSFWDRTYPEVRKELRGRYPKHPWPEDPWTAPPTARTKRKV